jgi:Ser/Thr protein kinase RdoA (MazF antagonist)
MTDPHTIANAFDFGRQVEGVKPYGQGLINDTYRVALTGGNGKSALLQRLNRRAFPEPERIMRNLKILAAHTAKKPAPTDLHFPAFYSARDGRDYVKDAQGEFWRAMEFIENTQSLGVLTRPEQAGEVGRALARFHSLFADLDVNALSVTRPGFHQTPLYFARLQEAVAKHASAAHDAAVRESIDFVNARKPVVGILEEAKAQNRLTLSVIHGDPKLDNFLFDRSSGRAVSLIDLDTVQPGLRLYDLGDCLRSCANPAGESPRDTDDARFDLPTARAVLQSYARTAPDLLTAAVREFLFEAVRLIPLELGMRFLTDHLEGNAYFKVQWPGHNLHRARVQLALVKDIERQHKELRGLIDRLD